MTETFFTACEQQTEIIASSCLVDNDFRDEMIERSLVWELDFDTFLIQVSGVISVALYTAYSASRPQSQPEAVGAALAYLQNRRVVEMFAAISRESSIESRPLLKYLRTLSIGLTAKSAIHWERLTEAARIFLQADIELR